jgi:hypothetical protein
MTDPENYLTYKVINDKYIALNKKGFLMTWNLVTGKLLGSYELHNKWTLKYENHAS